MKNRIVRILEAENINYLEEVDENFYIGYYYNSMDELYKIRCFVFSDDLLYVFAYNPIVPQCLGNIIYPLGKNLSYSYVFYNGRQNGYIFYVNNESHHSRTCQCYYNE